MTLKEVLEQAQKLTNNENEKHALFWLLVEMLNLKPSEYYLNEDLLLKEDFIKEYFNNVNKYLVNDIPVQYILNRSYFYNYIFYVDENTLVPRVETEELVFRTINYIKEFFKDKKEIKVLDLATGSGAIGITLKLELPNLDVTLSDISSKALKVAEINKKNLDANVKLVESNWFSNINEKFDVIISNPPYIPEQQAVISKTLSEPNLALFSGKDGLDSYREILKDVKKHLNNRALIAFENGYDQKSGLNALIKENLNNVKIVQEKDLANLDRYTFVFVNEGKILDE